MIIKLDEAHNLIDFYDDTDKWIQAMSYSDAKTFNDELKDILKGLKASIGPKDPELPIEEPMYEPMCPFCCKPSTYCSCGDDGDA